MNRTNHSPEFVANKWKPGQSGNALGRPKDKSFEVVVRGILAEVIPGTDTDKLEALARVVIDEAIMNRNTQVIKILAERLWPVTKTIGIKLPDPKDVKLPRPPRTIEQMRATLRIVGEVIDVEADVVEATE